MKFKNLLFRAQNHCEMEEEMATHFTILAGKIPWTEEPDRSRRVGHDQLLSVPL